MTVNIDREFSEQSLATFRRWTQSGWAIGVFQNADLGSRDIGRRIALPFDPDELAQAVIGVTRAPDTAIGLGWRYLLRARCHTPEEALDALVWEPHNSSRMLQEGEQ